MEKTSTMKQARTSVLVALALICAVSCAKIDDGSSAVAPEQPVQPTVLLPTRSYEEALSLARKSIALVDRGQTRSATARSIRSERGQCVTTPSTRSGVGTDTLMYVFNFEGDDGFSIIAANRAVDPVLAVAEKGNYTYGEPTGVENFDFYMDVMAQSLAVIKPPKFDTIRTTPKFKTVEVNESRSCEPLIPVNWGQGFPYGDYCSNKTSGCVATAIAQIMAYYRFPPSFTTTYTDAPHAGETIALDWNYLINYSYGYQISALLREIGERVDMDYTAPNSSSASSNNVPNCMKSFGYVCFNGLVNYFNGSVQGALDKERPVYVDGRNAANTRDGHAWVADGYKYSRIGTEYYEERLIKDGLRPAHYEYVLISSDVETTNMIHFNWGAYGMFNGYYTPMSSYTVNGTTFNGIKMIDSIWLYRSANSK